MWKPDIGYAVGVNCRAKYGTTNNWSLEGCYSLLRCLLELSSQESLPQASVLYFVVDADAGSEEGGKAITGTTTFSGTTPLTQVVIQETRHRHFP